MPSTVIVAGIGQVKIIRRARTKSVRIRINHDGQPEITAPKYVPLYLIKKFADSKADWIAKHSRDERLIAAGSLIGRSHYVRVELAKTLSVRVKGKDIIVGLPDAMSMNDTEVQAKLKSKAIECLRKEAKAALPRIVKKWSDEGVGTYNKVTIKLIKTRWGSYSSGGSMNLSLFMAQLPNELIDYIIVHELSHSKHMNHSKAFWEHVAKYIPNHKQLRKELRKYNMTVEPS